MKEKRRPALLPALIILALSGACAWFLLRPQALGNINASFTQPTTSISDFSFRAAGGDRVRLSFQSDIKAGQLELALYDSRGNQVYLLDHARSLKTFYTFGCADTYTLKAEYTGFIGNFKIAVYPARA